MDGDNTLSDSTVLSTCISKAGTSSFVSNRPSLTTAPDSGGTNSLFPCDVVTSEGPDITSHLNDPKSSIRLPMSEIEAPPRAIESPAPDISTRHRPRKGHRKSRRGCYNCKIRKIKCQENLPTCDSCSRKMLECKYPPAKSDGKTSDPGPLIQLQGTPMIFSMNDMRLFHHFLLNAYPYLPVGNDNAWVCDIPLVAHHNEYLMHAILGLAATHLQLLTGQDYKATALNHRYLAIKGSNEALSRPQSGNDADALLGTCYALTFQTSYMSDGFSEFMQMARGCSLISKQFQMDGLPTCFGITGDRHWNYMEDRLLDLPIIDSELVDGSARSLAAISPMCNSPSTEEFCRMLLDVVAALSWSSMEGYLKFIFIYQMIGNMENENFQAFIDPRNQISKILLAHFVVIQMIMAPILDREWSGRSMKAPVRGHFDWITMIYDDMNPELRMFLEWPKAVSDYVRLEIAGSQTPAPFY